MEEGKKEEVEKVDKNEDAKAQEKAEVSDTKSAEKTKSEEKKAEVKKETPKEPKKKMDSKKKKTIIKVVVFLIVVIAIVVALLVWLLVFKKKTIDLSKYIEVEYDGFNGYASVVSVTLNEDLKDELDSSKVYKNLLEKFKYEIDEESMEDLSNGDEIEIKVKISSSFLDNNKLKLQSDTVTVTVEGLEDADVLDLFDEDDFEIEVTGISPKLSVSVNSNSKDSFIRNYVYYSLSESYNLANGDVITITATYNEEEATKQGLVIASDTMEYTIEDMPEYVDEVEDLTTDILSTIETGATTGLEDEIESQMENSLEIYDSEQITISEPELVSQYLLTPKSTSSYYANNNVIAGIYKVTATATTGETAEYYFVITTYDVAIQDDEIYFEDDDDELTYYSKGGGETEDDAYSDGIGTSSNKSSYIIEEID